MLLTALALAAPERILAVDNYVVASTIGGRWRAADEGFARRHASASFRPFGLASRAGGRRRRASSGATSRAAPT